MRDPTIVKMLQTLPAWEQDTVVTLLSKGSLNHWDEERAYALLKEEFGVLSSTTLAPPRQITYSDMSGIFPTRGPLLLTGITAGAGCNALLPGTTFPVDPTIGLQIYLGRNGSGKSSYVRLLRSAGSARIRTSILPDVFIAESANSSAQAVFQLEVDGEWREIHWSEQQGPHPLLSAVAVYDNECSSVYLEKGTVADYLPRGLDIFATLVDLRKSLKARLEAEVSSLESQQYDMPAEVDWGTEVSQILRGYDMFDFERSGEVPAVFLEKKYMQIRNMGTWTEDDELRYRELQEQYREHSAIEQKYAEHIKQTAELANHIRSIETAQAVLDDIANRVSADLGHSLMHLAALRDQKKSDLASAKAERARRFRPNTDTTTFLSGVGSAEWLALVEAAQVFSNTHAYSHSSFPETSDGARCPLCQQLLDSEASDRLVNFSRALTAANEPIDIEDPEIGRLLREVSVVETELVDKVRGVDEALAAISVISRNGFPDESSDDLVMQLAAMGLILSGIAAKARQAQYDDLNVAELQAACREATAKFSAAKSHLSYKQKWLGDLPDPTQDSTLAVALKEYRARKWLSKNIDLALQKVTSIQYAKFLRRAAGSLSIAVITNLSKRVAAELVTDRLIANLREQLDAVGLGYLKAQVVTSGQSGVTTIRLAPPAKTFKKTDMSQVLSEGEQALMGLAAFFAELEVAGHTGPIVLDDPISGLDQNNQRIMAERLAEAGMERQVLVLTHDEAFVSMLVSAARERGVNEITRAMTRDGGRIGYVG